jgi:aerotaxis receptor
MNKVVPIDEEYFFDGPAIISQTDSKGIITYVNREFSEVSGYSSEELIGKPFNTLRHPDMPKVVFEKMWSVIQSGQAWNGILKDLRKDGKFYWVDTGILPIKDNDDKIIGYIAVQRAAARKDIQGNEETYKKMLETQD